MIPTIETIVNDVVAGKITQTQAIAWLNKHAEDSQVRDYFAGQAIIGWADRDCSIEYDAATAFKVADAMMAARGAK